MSRYNQDEVRGFYYDHQVMNPLFTVSLHPNTRPMKGGTTGVDWTKKGLVNSNNDIIIEGIQKLNKEIDRHYDREWDEFYTNGYSSDPAGNPYDGYLEEVCPGSPWGKYYAEPICSSIFSEDFNFQINNEWTGWDGGNAIENLFKSAKPYAPMLGTLGDGLQKAAKSFQGEGDGLGSSWAGAVNSAASILGGLASNASEHLNKALYIQGTRYTMYNGTSTNFGSMSMKFTLLSDWRPLYPGSNKYVFMSVLDQFNRIYPYCIGLFQKHQGGLGWITEKLEDGELKTAINQFVESHVGWQNPPGGFESMARNIDVQQQGTLRLMLGGYYTIDNLVIKSCNVNMSRQLCKHPLDENRMVPMYADISLDLQPASVYTDAALGRFIHNDGMTEMIKNLQKIEWPPETEEKAKAQTENAVNTAKAGDKSGDKKK